jgi:serine/threonine protein phosphatase PrpC
VKGPDVERSIPTAVGGIQLVQALLSDIGCRRKKNEDALGFYASETAPATHLAVVCDGVGGNAAGEVASQIALETLEASFFGAGNPDDIGGALRRAVEAANTAILHKAALDPRLAHMATTCTAVALRGEGLRVGHIGDCRAYRIEGAVIQQLTHDHSVAEEYARRGEPLPADKQGLANVLTRCLGLEPHVEVDLSETIPFREGNILVMCSDGLTKMVTPQEILYQASMQGPEDACQRLVAMARERGGPDNISVQVIRYRRF